MSKVISTPQNFRQGDMTRAIKAAANAGAKFVRFTIGKMIIEVPISAEAAPVVITGEHEADDVSPLDIEAERKKENA